MDRLAKRTVSDEALASLMARLEKRARRLTGNAEAARDLVQETVLHLWERLLCGPEIEDTKAYAMTIVRNLATSRWRRGRDCADLDAGCLTTDPEAPARMAVASLLTAIDRLPADQSRLMRLVAQGETSPAILACQTGVPVGTVMSRLSRARARLRADLDLPPKGAVAALI